MNKYLTKIAEVELREHQRRAVDKAKDRPLLAVHSLGSGKTLTALTLAQENKQRGQGQAIVIAPASLTTNMWKEVDKHGLGLTPDDMKVISYQKLTSNPDFFNEPHGTIILDESHRLRNKGTQMYKAVREVLNHAPDANVMALTGTPVYNKPEDIAVILNTIAKQDLLPEEPAAFENRYFKKVVEKPTLIRRILGDKPIERLELTNKEELSKIFRQHVDFYDAKDSPDYAAHFPSSREEVVEVHMNDKQQKIYDFLEGQIPPHVRMKIQKGLPLSKSESRDLNAFSTGVRQASNTSAPFVSGADKSDPDHKYSPKLIKATEDFVAAKAENPAFKGIIYSNYVDAGLNPMKELLDQNGVKSTLYTGKLNARQKKDVMDSYNRGEVDALLVSSSGSEGLDLKGSRMVQILEPHFNESKIDQVIGRAIRYKSHEDLPEEDRNVVIKRYISERKPGRVSGALGIKNKAIDTYLKDLSLEKEKLKNELLDVMRGNNG